MNINKTLVGLGLGALAIIGGGLMQVGCPTKAVESQHTYGQCARIGAYTVYADRFAPNATAIEQFGRDHLAKWNTSPEALDAKFQTLLPKGVAHFTAAPSEGCLSAGMTRTLYNNITSKVTSWLTTFKPADCLEKAHAASRLRSEARETAREKMCDQAEVRVLRARDRSEYGTEKPNFAYMIGKYAQKAVGKCKHSACDIKNATCGAILDGAKKTNQMWNWIASFL